MHTPMQIQTKILKLSKQTINEKSKQNKSYKTYSKSPTLKLDIVFNVQNIRTIKDKRMSLIVGGVRSSSQGLLHQ